MNLEKMLKIALLTPMGNPNLENCVWGLPLLLWGAPGIGKTSRVRATAAAVGLMCESTIPATRQPEDFSGVLMPDGKGGAKLMCLLGAANRLIEHGKGRGVLFLDEASQARPAVQAALMSVVHDRVIGDTALPPGIRILLAANPPKEAAGGWELEPPMANRMAHIDVKNPSADEWNDWFLTEKADTVEPIEEGEKKISLAWPSVWPRIKGMMTGFIKAQSTLLYNLPADGHEDRGRNWPSPRTWEMAARSAATALALMTAKDKDSTLTNDMVQACVGKGAATEWAKWVAEADLPDPVKMLEDGWDPDKRRLDRTSAAYASMISHVLNCRDESLQKKLAGRAWELLDKLYSQPVTLPDLAVPGARALVRSKFGSHVCPEARTLILKFGNNKKWAKLIEEDD